MSSTQRQSPPLHRQDSSPIASGLPIDFNAHWRRRWIARLLAWFDLHARDLPWRRTRDLYAIWISEIMLQQTQVATVVLYWQRFLARFPDVQSLAAAPEDEVLRSWEGLGYYRRARLMHAAARQIVARHGGQFPRTYDEVRRLPGIGRYTAGAILSIGLDQRLPVLEANTIRVLSRLIALDEDPRASAGQRVLWAAAEALLPDRRCGAVNQALMELGSTLCTGRDPACPRCPLAGTCLAYQQGRPEAFPKTRKRTRYEEVTEIAVVVRRRGAVLLRRCAPGERWAGLWDFLRFSWRSPDGQPAILSAPREPLDPQIQRSLRRQCQQHTGVAIRNLRWVKTLQHGVTRFRITLHCFQARLAGPETPAGADRGAGGPWRWVSLRELDHLPLSSTGRAIARLLVEENPLQGDQRTGARAARLDHRGRSEGSGGPAGSA